jgi:molecular chaperone DnaK (HSP70)
MDKSDWLVFFRRAKTQATLDIMLDAKLEVIPTIAEKAAAILAHELRQGEIIEGRFCNKVLIPNFK